MYLIVPNRNFFPNTIGVVFFKSSIFHLFDYRVEKTEWNDVTGKWTVTTSTGKKYLANFVFSASGALHIPNDTRFTGYLFSEDTFLLKLFKNLSGRGRCEFTPKSYFYQKLGWNLFAYLLSKVAIKLTLLYLDVWDMRSKSIFDPKEIF